MKRTISREVTLPALSPDFTAEEVEAMRARLSELGYDQVSGPSSQAQGTWVLPNRRGRRLLAAGGVYHTPTYQDRDGVRSSGWTVVLPR